MQPGRIGRLPLSPVSEFVVLFFFHNRGNMFVVVVFYCCFCFCFFFVVLSHGQHRFEKNMFAVLLQGSFERSGDVSEGGTHGAVNCQCNKLKPFSFRRPFESKKTNTTLKGKEEKQTKHKLEQSENNATTNKT